MHDDGSDLPRPRQTDVLPGRSGISGPVHTIADDHVAANTVGARPHVDDLRVRVGDVDRPDGSRAEVSVGDVPPDPPVVRRLPHTAAGSAHEEGGWLVRVSGHGGDPAAAGGANGTVLELGKERGIVGVVRMPALAEERLCPRSGRHDGEGDE